MSKPNWVVAALAVVVMATAVCPAFAQKLDATVLYRQNSDTDYNALIPGYSGTTDCAANPTDQECSPATRTAPLSSAANDVTYNVVGTTLSLLLPDGRVAVLNCVNKFSSNTSHIHSRTCGMPMVEHVQAQFNGASAKLEWPIAPGGKKLESETYKVVAVLNKKER